MEFYCPVCQQTLDIVPESNLTTKLGQQAFKAHCPTCQQEVVAIGSRQENAVQPAPPSIIEGDAAQQAVDQALKEFGSAS